MAYKDKLKQREFSRMWVAKRREEFFNDKICAFCGSKVKLELHHIDPKTKKAHNIWSWSDERRKEELEKCIVLCRKCHQIETIKQRNPPFEHGQHQLYRRGCRCELCHLAYKEYDRVLKRERRRKKKNMVFMV